MCEPTTHLLFIADNTGENLVGRNGAEADVAPDKNHTFLGAGDIILHF